LAALAGLAVAAAFGAAPGTAREPPDRSWADQARKKPAAGRAVGNLPHAGGRSFRSLDAYLAWLRDYAAPIDRPWYREIAPGRYRLETGNLRPNRPARVFTREELERRFGFRR